jgi:hypothetical protein
VPKKLRPGKGAKGTAKVAAASVHRIPLPPQAVLTLFSDLTIEADYPNILEVHERSIVSELLINWLA